MEDILQNISEIVISYDSGQFKDLHLMHRKLTSNMYYLSQEQVKAHARHNATYYNSKQKTNAAKEREADKLVPELYMCRKIMEAAKGVSIAMSLEIKLN